METAYSSVTLDSTYSITRTKNTPRCQIPEGYSIIHSNISTVKKKKSYIYKDIIKKEKI